MRRETDWRGEITGKEQEMDAEEGRKRIKGWAPAGGQDLDGRGERAEVLKQLHAFEFSLKSPFELYFNCHTHLFFRFLGSCPAVNSYDCSLFRTRCCVKCHGGSSCHRKS